MENQIELSARMIVEKLPSNAPSNTITLWDVEEQVMTFPMFMDDEDETAQEQEESTFPNKGEAQQEIMEMRHDDLPLITTVMEKSKKVECLPENKNEYEEDELEKENESRVEKSWKQPKENDEKRRHLMKFKGNFEKAKRHQSLCYEKSLSFFLFL
ncbi:hypothetical protein M9H77_07944 [Catharanthus roseus]|uniref:Uncharacterized protein n=1 Tax=Catharanthus roseus TaxID=4058 RepID=A0ACC0BWN9_CATRO|nr:hypothetical protein M9H77_07944 [Catharanthus roseus]